MIWLTAAIALAQDCPTHPLRVGIAPEFVAVVEGRAACDGVVVPPSYAERAAEMAAELARARADLVAVTADRDALRLELIAAELERDHYRAEATSPPPLLARPGVCHLVGAGSVVLGGWALGQAAR